ncbi:O-methyltransferase [bacterium]|nr:O-methyltransferase [bacterium]
MADGMIRMDIINPYIDAYLTQLAVSKDDEVLLEMEAVGIEKDFPIVGPQVGRLLQVLTLLSRAKTVFELGSGYGYSTLWFARAMGPEGVVHHTDLSGENRTKAREYLTCAGVIDRVRFHEGDAVEAFKKSGVTPDILFMDIDKEQYPAGYEAFKDRLNPGALVIVDNLLWDGRVIDMKNTEKSTLGVKRYTDLILADKRFVTTIVPVRDGVAVSLKTS